MGLVSFTHPSLGHRREFEVHSNIIVKTGQLNLDVLSLLWFTDHASPCGCLEGN